MEIIIDLIRVNMLDSEKIIKWRGKENLSGLTVENLLENISRIKNKVMEFLLGLTVF